MTARRLAYLLILQTLLLIIGGGVLLRHAFAQPDHTIPSPLIFVVAHDTALHTLYDSLTTTIQTLPPQTPIGIIRASDEPLYLVPDTSDTASLLAALPLFPQLAPTAQLTTLLPTVALINNYVVPHATIILLTDTSILPRSPDRTTQLSTLVGKGSFAVVDANPNSPLASQSTFPVIAPKQLHDYLAQHHSINSNTSSAQIDRKRLFFILLGI